MNPRDVRPRRDWALVLANPRKLQLDSGLFLPGEETGIEKVTELAGEIIRLGPSEHVVRETGVKEGDKVVFRGFLKYASPVPHDEKWPDGQRKEYFLIALADILAITQPGCEVGVFSGRPMQSGAVEVNEKTGKARMTK